MKLVIVIVKENKRDLFSPEQKRGRFARGGAVCVNPSVGWSIIEIRPLSNLKLAAKLKLRKFARTFSEMDGASKRDLTYPKSEGN